MNIAMSQQAVSEVSSDALDELRYHLLRISTSGDIGEDLEHLLERSLDAAAILDHFPEFFFIKDRRSRYVYVNPALAAAAGLDNSARMLGTTVFDHMRLEKAEELFVVEQQLMTADVGFSEREEFIEALDREPVWVEISKMPLHNALGDVIGLIGVARDITERKRQEELRRCHAMLLEMIARGQPLSTVLEALTDLVEKQLRDVYACVLLLDEESDRLRHGAAPGLPEAYVRLIDGVEIGPRTGSCGAAAWRRAPVISSDIQGDPLWGPYADLAVVFGLRSCWSTPIISADAHVLGTFALYSKTVREPTRAELELVAVATDLAGIAIERARNEERIRHMAHHDALTGLPNRAFFWTQFNRTLSEARRSGQKVTVAYIDLDNFKQINDRYGHAAGDEVLKILAGRMAACVRASDLIVRLGGDEFAIVFPNAFQEEPIVVRRLQEVRSALSSPVVVDRRDIRATCSMGVAFFPQDGDTPEALLASADRAMYEAKQLGRDGLRVSHSMLGSGAGI